MSNHCDTVIKTPQKLNILENSAIFKMKGNNKQQEFAAG